MPITTLVRKDRYLPNKSFVKIYDTRSLYKMKDKYRISILRIVKKTLLGTNFCFWYSKHDAIISAALNFVVINICFILFPKILFKSIPKIQQTKVISTDEKNNISVFSEEPSKKSKIFLRVLISNILDLICLSILVFGYKRKQKKISKYMKKYTQCSLISENYKIKKHYHCLISKDDNFNIEIHKSKKVNNNKFENKNIFFEYVINLPNIRFLSNYLYRKIFSLKEKEIIDKIMMISNEIEYKYKKKFVNFLFLTIGFMLILSFMGLMKEKNKYEFFNYLGILLLSLFVQNDIYSKNKKEQLNRISELSEEYLNDGYFIYINEYMISIFYLKEEYKNDESLDNIKQLNENLIKEFGLV